MQFPYFGSEAMKDKGQQNFIAIERKKLVYFYLSVEQCGNECTVLF